MQMNHVLLRMCYYQSACLYQRGVMRITHHTTKLDMNKHKRDSELTDVVSNCLAGFLFTHQSFTSTFAFFREFSNGIAIIVLGVNNALGIVVITWAPR